MRVNDASRIIINASGVMLQIVTSLTNDLKGIIYDHNMFIVQAIGDCVKNFFTTIINSWSLKYALAYLFQRSVTRTLFSQIPLLGHLCYISVLYHKAFYGRNYFGTAIKLALVTVCHCLHGVIFSGKSGAYPSGPPNKTLLLRYAPNVHQKL